MWPCAFSWKVSSGGLCSRSPLLCQAEDKLAQEASYATSPHCYGSCSNPWNFWGLDRPWLWNWNLVDTRSTKRNQVEHSGTGYSATCGQAHWQHWVGAEFWKWNSLDHCVQLHSPTQTTCRVFLAMLCALFQKSAAIVFCYPAGFEEEEHSVPSFQHSKGGDSLVWCGLRLETWQWPYFEQTGARCQEAHRTLGTIGAFTTWGKSKSIPAVVSLIPQTWFCCL